MHDLRKRRGSVDIDALHHGGFRGILERHDESLLAAALGFQVLPDIGRARLIVIRFPYGHRKALLEMAEVTLSLLSLTAVSGSPTIAILSVFPHPTWTSISISNA